MGTRSERGRVEDGGGVVVVEGVSSTGKRPRCPVESKTGSLQNLLRRGRK